MVAAEASGARERWRFVLFVLAGGIAALTNIVSRAIFNLAIPFEWAVVPAYACGMTTAYVLNRRWVFPASGRSIADEYLRFTAVNLLAAAQVWVVSVGLARLVFPWTGFGFHPELVAHMIGVASPILTSFLGHKHFSFRAR